MATDLHRLTLLDIQAATAKRLPDGGGLFLQTSPGGGRSWVYIYKVAGQQKQMGLGVRWNPGRIADFIAEGRRKAKEARDRIAGGEDPLAHKRAAKAAARPVEVISFEEAARRYLDQHGQDWSAKYTKEWNNSLTNYINPKIGRAAVSDVSVDDVKRILAPHWKRVPETAERTRSRIEIVLDYARAHGWRPDDAPNPAAKNDVQQRLGAKRPPVKHQASVPWKACPALVYKIEARIKERKGYDMPALALLWVMATATRSFSARHVEWSELQLDKRTWVIPAAKMKGEQEHKRPHKVPLSDFALHILKLVPKHNQRHVFHGQKAGQPVSDTALRRVMRELGVTKEQGNVHGFRASFRTWGGETNAAAVPVLRACLAHASPGAEDRVDGAYDRGTFWDLRIPVMQAWGSYLQYPFG